MFEIVCLSCKTLIDVHQFMKGRVQSCPQCQTGATSAEKEPDYMVLCPHCGSRLKANEKVLGKTLPCPKCKETFLVDMPATTKNKLVISFDDLGTATPVFTPVPAPVTPPNRPAVSHNPALTLGANAPAMPSGKLPPRMRRLYADAESVTKGLAKSRYLRVVRLEGTPPDVYTIEYRIRGVESVQGNKINYRDQHVLEIRLTSEYPSSQPKCRLLTPIFHPNFEPAVICIGDHWTAQERLIDLIVRIGEMIAYQSYNIKSPLDGEAAMWADLNGKILPTDKSDLLPPD